MRYFYRNCNTNNFANIKCNSFFNNKVKVRKVFTNCLNKEGRKTLTLEMISLLQHILPSSFVNSLQIHVFGFTKVNKSCMLMVIIYSDNDT